MNNHVIKLHPAIIHTLDGDFDGDTCHIAIPLNKKSQQDLLKMDVLHFITKHPEEFRPGKEINKAKPIDWSNNPLTLQSQIKQVAKATTNGQSISYHDLCDPNTIGYFTGTKVNREELAYFSQGIAKDEVVGFRNPDSEKVRGVSIANAIKDYRTIKTLVPKSGGLSNSLMALAIAKCYNDLDKIHKVAKAKHILCQDGLSAKHGTNKVESADKLYGAFYRGKTNAVNTREEYETCMREFGLPEDSINVIMELFWTEEPENINNLLRILAPHYIATRRGAEIDFLEDIVENPDEISLQKEFIDHIIHPEVKIAEQHSKQSGRRGDQVPGLSEDLRVLGRTSVPIQIQGKGKKGVVKTPSLT